MFAANPPWKTLFVPHRLVSLEAKSELARQLGKLGASKGGVARAKKLSSKRRTEIATKAGKARWNGVSKVFTDGLKEPDAGFYCLPSNKEYLNLFRVRVLGLGCP
jgi:hypothetical protein